MKKSELIKLAAKALDANEPYIYLSLQYQPDTDTVYLAGEQSPDERANFTTPTCQLDVDEVVAFLMLIRHQEQRDDQELQDI